MMTKILKVSAPIFTILLAILYFLDPSSIIPLFLIFVFLHIAIFGYEILKKELEISIADKYFLVFFKNLSRSVEVGISPIIALIQISKEKYGEITKHFRIFKRKLEASINIDYAFNYLLTAFKDNRKIYNSIKVLNFELKSGYGLRDAINSLYDYILKINEVEREKKVVISQFTIMFYVISLLFAIIIFVLIKVLTPIYSQFIEASKNVQPLCLNYYVEISSFKDFICKLYFIEASIFKKELKPTEAYIFAVLLNLALLQSIFSGIIIGYGAEKSVAKAILHATILFIVIFVFFFILGKVGIL